MYIPLFGYRDDKIYEYARGGGQSAVDHSYVESLLDKSGKYSGELIKSSGVIQCFVGLVGIEHGPATSLGYVLIT